MLNSPSFSAKASLEGFQWMAFASGDNGHTSITHATSAGIRARSSGTGTAVVIVFN